MLNLFKRFLFCLEPEKAHDLALKSIQTLYRLRCSRFFVTTLSQPIKVMGLTFDNPLGLAAGFDKNADYVDALASLGFGFIEVGTVTPKPQEGNPLPRLFRLKEKEAIINRLGFNNKGVHYAVKKLEKMRYRGVLGINIGKNKDTLLEKALDDYLFCFEAIWHLASYVTINISSPNTVGLRDLQQTQSLQPLLSALKSAQKNIAETHGKYVPLVVKISPDLKENELHDMAQLLLSEKMDGVIATNTTIDHQGIEDSPFFNETGGLSGRPLCARNTHVIRTLHTILKDHIPIIASGGIMDEASAQEKIKAGATLLQIYTGFIYHGPNLITRVLSSF